MDKIRIGIIGMGSMGKGHYSNIKTIPEFEITALSDVNPDSLKDYKETKFEKPEALINSGLVDAVAIVTPHFSHVPLATEALKKGLHVLVEKPVAVHVNEVRGLLKAHTDKKLKLAVMFNCRTNPPNAKIKQMISSGELGRLQRASMIVTDWYRPEAYFKSAGWRATWAGEGGGALLNQCPHNLDLFQWFVGMPSRITANVGFGKFHDIEVEDEVSALLEFPGGMTGVFITSTGEAPGTNRIEIAGDKGKLTLENGVLSFVRNEIPTSEHLKTTTERFEKPAVWNVAIPVREIGFNEQHQSIHRNFKDAILKDTPLIAPVSEGMASLELANAMLLSGFLKKTIDLPLDGDCYFTELQKRMKTSRFKA